MKAKWIVALVSAIAWGTITHFAGWKISIALFLIHITDNWIRDQRSNKTWLDILEILKLQTKILTNSVREK